MNIAILIGVSNYLNNITNLPGSKNDVLLFDELIKSTKKFDAVLTISNDTDSRFVKSKLTNFINENKLKKIDEVLFYFSGHGDFSNNEFYYILSDFNFEMKTQTSLQNSELDNLIKSLSPKLVTKIVDACHSGLSYIKDFRAVDTYIKSTSNIFKTCYFLYSSLNSQSSYQDSNYSFFTLSFLNAIKSFKGEKIRYKDIIDYISDNFSSFPEQTPFFVTQANFTELFCTKNKNIDESLHDLPPTFPSTEEVKPNLEFSSLEELVKNDSKNNFTNEQVNQILNEIKGAVEEFSLDNKIMNLYQIKLSYPKYIKSHVDFSTIGEFARNNDDEYFAKATFKTEHYEELKKPTAFEVAFNKLSEPYTVKKTREVVSGYSLTAEYPFKQIIIELRSTYPNIDSYNCSIAFLSSDRKIKLYFFITNYIKRSWDSEKLNSRFEWDSAEFHLIKKDDIKNFVLSINEKINLKILGDLTRKFDVTKK